MLAYPVHLVLNSCLIKYLEMELQDYPVVHSTSQDWASIWLNLPIMGITELLGTAHTLSNSDLYPNVCLCVQTWQSRACQQHSDFRCVTFPLAAGPLFHYSAEPVFKGLADVLLSFRGICCCILCVGLNLYTFCSTTNNSFIVRSAAN